MKKLRSQAVLNLTVRTCHLKSDVKMAGSMIKGDVKMAQTQLIVYPTKDLQQSKTLFASLLGTDPYVDAAYYVGYRTEGQEIGLDPHGSSSGPIAYWATDDITTRVADLTAAGWQVVSEPRDVGGGMLVAQLRDGNGSTIGLRQAPK